MWVDETELIIISLVVQTLGFHQDSGRSNVELEVRPYSSPTHSPCIYPSPNHITSRPTKMQSRDDTQAHHSAMHHKTVLT